MLVRVVFFVLLAFFCGKKDFRRLAVDFAPSAPYCGHWLSGAGAVKFGEGTGGVQAACNSLAWVISRLPTGRT
jgi:hypothetical protein